MTDTALASERLSDSDQVVLDSLDLDEVNNRYASSNTLSAESTLSPFDSATSLESLSGIYTASGSAALVAKRRDMRTGCIACL